MEIDQLRPQFMEQVIDFRKMIAKNVRTKRIKGKEINSDLLVNLLKIYVGEINGKEMPQIETGWKYVCARECEQVMGSVQREIEEALGKLMDHPAQTQTELNNKTEAIR